MLDCVLWLQPWAAQHASVSEAPDVTPQGVDLSFFLVIGMVMQETDRDDDDEDDDDNNACDRESIDVPRINPQWSCGVIVRRNFTCRQGMALACIDPLP